MNQQSDYSLKANKILAKNKNNLSLKRSKSRIIKPPLCQWCKGGEIKLVPVSSLVNLKPREVLRYSQIWLRQGWPTKLYLCWLCKQNCELAKQEINLWLCPRCRKCLVYGREEESETLTYNQLPTNCSCGWKKQRLSKVEQKRIADRAIKSRLSYQLDNKLEAKLTSLAVVFAKE